MADAHPNEVLFRLLIEPIELDDPRALADGHKDPVDVIRSLPPCRIDDPGLAREGIRRGRNLALAHRVERPEARGWLKIEAPNVLANFDELPPGPSRIVVVHGEADGVTLFSRPAPLT